MMVFQNAVLSNFPQSQTDLDLDQIKESLNLFFFCFTHEKIQFLLAHTRKMKIFSTDGKWL